MGFDKSSVPTRRSSAREKGLVGGRRGSEKNVIVPMHIQGEEFEFTEEEVARKSHTIKGLVSHTRARNESAAGGLGKRRPFTDVAISSKSLQAQATYLKCLAKRKVRVVAPTCRQADLPIVATQQSHRITRVAIDGMARELNAQLIVAQSKGV